MNLLIDSDQSPLTGWEGYDYILNRSRENGTVTVERFVTGDVMEFMDLGDAAPNGRFNYRYIKEGGRIVNPAPAVSAANGQTGQSTIIIIVAAVCICIAGIVCVVLYRLRTIKNRKS